MKITDEILTEIIKESLSLPDETDWVEFKVNKFDYETLGERISGISNTACLNNKDVGFLIYGIEDKTLNLVGTTFTPEKVKIKGQSFEIKLKQDINLPNIRIESIKYKGINLVIFIVPSAVNSPTKFNKEAFVRIGSATTSLNNYPDLERKIWNNIYNKNFEKQIAVSGLREEEIREYIDIDKIFILLNINKPENNEEILNTLIREKIIKKNLSRYEITNLGSVLFSNSFSKFDTINLKGVRLIVYDGVDKTAEIKSFDGDRGYALGFEELLKYITLLIPSYEKIRGGKRIKTNDYPSIAIREFVANAIIHQDLSIPGPGPIIEIYKDRIEITNPGEPIIDINRFIDIGKARNEDLSDIMRRMKFCEKLGSGFDKAIKAIEKEQLPAPKPEVQEGFTKIILYSSEKINSLTKDDKIRACFQHCCIRYIEKNYMTNASFRGRMNLADSQHNVSGNIISQTIEGGLIKVFDPENKANRYTKYVPYWHI